MSRINILSILTILLLVSSCASKPKMWEGENWKFHTVVKADEVKKMISFPMDEDKMIVDSRPYRPKFIKGHIPGAISIPYSKFDKMTDLLPKNKDARIVFYCGGLKCPLSHKSAWKAEYLGYKNVAVFAEGFPKWKKTKGNYASVSVEWMQKQIAKKKIVVVDSRPKRKKYDKGHIPGAISIPYSQFKKYKRRLPRNKKKTIVFYCGGHHCPLSHKSAKKAIAMGYKKVKVFSAGYPAWKKAMGGPKIKVKAGTEEGSIDHKTFLKVMKENPKQFYLVDVREPSEYKKASLPGAVNIPTEELEKRAKELPKNKDIVFVCNTGARSGEAYYMVQEARPSLKNIYYLDGAIKINKDGTFKLTKPE